MEATTNGVLGKALAVLGGCDNYSSGLLCLPK